MADGSNIAFDQARPIDGSCIDKWLRLRDPTKLFVRGFEKSRLAITEVRYDLPHYGASEAAIAQDAIAVGLQLRDYPLHELRAEGRVRQIRDVRAGDTLLCDLRSVDGVHTAVPFHSLQFFLSREFLDQLSDDLEAPRIDGLKLSPGQPVRDPLIEAFGRMAWSACARPNEVDALQASHAVLALGLHVCTGYAGLRPPKGAGGGLSRVQERIAKEMIASQLDGAFSVNELAAFCGLSPSRFAHAFKISVGVSPHQWLLRRRIEHARLLLGDARHNLADIALDCGFADQSHFTRVFRRDVGTTPDAWRRERR